MRRIDSLIKHPISKNFLVSGLGIGCNLLFQILLVPFFLSQWGVLEYGDWIVLTSVCNIISMSDVGLNTVTSNLFSIRMAEGNKLECYKLLTNNFLLLFAISFFCIIGVFLFVSVCDVFSFLDLSVIQNNSAKNILILLSFQVLIGMISGVVNTAYRAKSKLHQVMLIDNVARFTEGGILFVGLLLGGTPLVLTIFYIIPKFVALIYKYYDMQTFYPFRIKKRYIDLSLFKQLLLPSFSFFSFPIGNAIVLQGYTLLVNKYFGGESVVLYNTTRTLCNFVKTIMGTISASVWPEVSIAYGQRDFGKVRRIHHSALLLSMLSSIIIAVCLLCFGSSVYKIWTKGTILFDSSLMLAFVIVLIVGNIWSTSSVVLSATNNHSTLGLFYLTGTGLSLLLAFVFQSHFHSLVPIVYSLLLSEILLSIYTIWRSSRIFAR